jgi:hypothetical protein
MMNSRLTEIAEAINKLKTERQRILEQIKLQKQKEAEAMQIKISEMKSYAVALCDAQKIPFEELLEGYRFPEFVHIRHLICSHHYGNIPTSAIAELLNISSQQVLNLVFRYFVSETKFKHKKNANQRNTKHLPTTQH